MEEATVEATKIVFAVLALAGLTEATTEYAFGRWDKLKGWPVAYLALVLGEAVAYAFELDLFAALLDLRARAPLDWAGVVLTGLLVGRGSSFVHDYYITYLKPRK